MNVVNLLPILKSFLMKYETKPSQEAFVADYLEPVAEWIQPMLDDFFQYRGAGFYEEILNLDWKLYRDEAILIDSDREEKRVRKHIQSIEMLLGKPLKGEVVLLGAFTMMDGYARFDRGEHRVFLGVDESHGRGAYLDVLITHELTHVIRESSPDVWQGFGLNLKMSHDEFGEKLPVIEHLFSEGFSCVVSELLNPIVSGAEVGAPESSQENAPWNYVYQTQDSLELIYLHGECVTREIHQELTSPDGYFRTLYDSERYRPGSPQPFPMYSHYVWAWQWVKHLLATYAQGDIKKLVNVCSNVWIEDALKFKLRSP